MKLVFCTDVVNGHYPLPSVLLWGYNLVHDQTRSGQASCNWHKMSGHAQQSGEDHAIQTRVLNSYFCQKLKIKEAKAQKYWKSYHVTTENNNKILTILVSIRSFLLQQIPHRKGSPDISKHIRGSKVSHKNTNWAESFDNLGVPLHKPSACNNPKTPLSLALHLFNRDSTKNHHLSRSFRILQPTACPRGWAGLKSSSSTWKNSTICPKFSSNLRNVFFLNQGVSWASTWAYLLPRMELLVGPKENVLVTQLIDSHPSLTSDHCVDATNLTALN